MKKLIRYMACVLGYGFIATAILSCGGGWSSPQVQSFQGGPSGVMIEDLINRVTIQVPPGAASENFEISVSKAQGSFDRVELLSGQSLPVVGPAFEIEISLVAGLGKFALVTIPYDTALASDSSRVGVAFFDESENQWIPVDVIRVDEERQRVTFLTTHFSTWAPIYYQMLNGSLDSYSIDTEFRPEKDGFPFNNKLPAPYDQIPGIDIIKFNGNCTGMSGLAAALFKNRLPSGGGLHDFLIRGQDPYNSAYFPIYEGVNVATGSIAGPYLGLSSNISNLFNRVSISNLNSASLVYRALWTEQGPVLVTFSGGISPHMVVVYQYVQNRDGSGTFYYYDPNYPREQRFFENRSNGSITPFDYGTAKTPAIAEYIYVSNGIGSVIASSEVRQIFRTYFAGDAVTPVTPVAPPPPVSTAPICLASVPPSGTLPYLAVVCVDDGSCPRGQVLQLIGGNNAAAPPIPRLSSCVPR